MPAREQEAALERLEACMRGLTRPLVAFSGGIDSSLVAYLAHRVHGRAMLAVTSASASLPRRDLALTRRLTQEWGCAHAIIETDELTKADYRANAPDRCYVCKSTLYDALWRFARRKGYHHVLNGTNADDLHDSRPGLRAAAEQEVNSPLLACSLSKAEVRSLARELGLRNAEKPQAACLSSRVPHGTPIDAPLLARIEAVEETLTTLGFGQLRLRHHDALARIEVPATELTRALDAREVIIATCRNAGYRWVTLDLQGYRQGGASPVSASSGVASPGTASPVAASSRGL